MQGGLYPPKVFCFRAKISLNTEKTLYQKSNLEICLGDLARIAASVVKGPTPTPSFQNFPTPTP